ncbi:MAG TPA: cysteine--tRNA ligase [Egibacteraceae bacterium]|nr:cysteine--tRNA ligase [Egibacteraceae bacterium]
MNLYDTRRRGTAELIAGRTVRVYVCGITPYDATHLGHAFTYTAFDVLIRYLEHLGHRVRYVRNVTDVDDDILRRARELSVDWQDLARREVERFDRDVGALGLREPDVVPLASQSIPAIRTAIEGLMRRGGAYALPDGRVYFDIAAAPEFGQLSQLDRPEMLRQFAEKGGDPQAPGKRDPLDFLLWQPSAPGEPSWPSTWGDGRPGWHIECSVMATEELGAVVDIHGGGSDLIFPHHEAEIAQSEQLTGQGPFASFWMHTGMVALDGVKMSKSLGNLVFAADLLECWEPGALRRYLLSHHYRQDWSHDPARVDDAAAGYKAWRDAAAGSGRREQLEQRFLQALDDDLDTPAAIEILDEASALRAGETLREMAAIMGFSLDQ